MRPSKPRCSIEGSSYVGNEVVLRCKSSDGTSPIQYTWEKTSDTKLLPANAVLGKGRGRNLMWLIINQIVLCSNLCEPETQETCSCSLRFKEEQKQKQS